MSIKLNFAIPFYTEKNEPLMTPATESQESRPVLLGDMLSSVLLHKYEDDVKMGVAEVATRAQIGLKVRENIEQEYSENECSVIRAYALRSCAPLVILQIHQLLVQANG